MPPTQKAKAKSKQEQLELLHAQITGFLRGMNIVEDVSLKIVNIGYPEDDGVVIQFHDDNTPKRKRLYWKIVKALDEHEYMLSYEESDRPTHHELTVQLPIPQA